MHRHALHNINWLILQRSFGYEKSMEMRILQINIIMQEIVPTNKGFGEPLRMLGRLSLRPMPAMATHSSIFPDLAKKMGIYVENSVAIIIVIAKPVTYHGGPLVPSVFSEDDEKRLNPMQRGYSNATRHILNARAWVA